MKSEKKITLTETEIKNCETFKQIRISYNMNQEQWADATGISYGLVKRIEAHTIKCSSKTKIKVHNFMEQNQNTPDQPDLHDLESHILFDIFLTYLNQVSKMEASICAGKCTKALQGILSYAHKCDSSQTQKSYFQFLEQTLSTHSFLSDINQEPDKETIVNATKSIRALRDILLQASRCDSSDAQKIYFQFLEQAFTTLFLAAVDIITDINNGTDVLNINNGLKKIFTGKQVKKFKDFGASLVSDTGEVAQQYDIFDLGFFDL